MSFLYYRHFIQLDWSSHGRKKKKKATVGPAAATVMKTYIQNTIHFKIRFCGFGRNSTSTSTTIGKVSET